ncbi:MAG TPA: hypothetical protein VK427_21315 [Kofleriaceae bacterium]|nr:hypothetical protein [Kofleriaceae bacterium]
MLRVVGGNAVLAHDERRPHRSKLAREEDERKTDVYSEASAGIRGCAKQLRGRTTVTDSVATR